MFNIRLRTLLLCSFVLLLALPGNSQVFAYVNNAAGKKAGSSGYAHKYEVARKVYVRIIQARGDFRQQPPELIMNDGEQYVAWMNPQSTQIGLEVKAYDLCMGFGPDSLNALAALLAHELTHYYEKHDWTRHFVQRNNTLESAQQIAGQEEGIQQETQADYLGGFLALTAGYDVYDILAQLLPQIYRSYGLPEVLSGYPSLSDRISMSKNASDQLRELQTVFETANYLSALGQYEAASEYYRFILQTFPSREIYNNLGVNQVLAALDLFSKSEMPFILPIEPDPNSRLYSLKGFGAGRLEKRKALLESAIEHFDRAAQLDPAYPSACLNKACAFTMLGSWDDAAYWLQKTRKIPGADSSAIRVLEAVQAALQKDSLRADQLLAGLAGTGNLLASVNLRLLHKEPIPREDRLPSGASDLIDQMLLDDFLANPTVDKEIKVSGTIICGAKQMPHSKILLHYADDGAHYTLLQICGKGCQEMTKKEIAVGDSAKRLEEIYSMPERMIARPRGQIWIYPQLNLLFELNETGTVQNWACFRQSID